MKHLCKPEILDTQNGYIYIHIIIYIYIYRERERERERNVFKTNLQDSHYSLTLKLIGQVLHVRKNVTSLKQRFHWLSIK